MRRLKGQGMFEYILLLAGILLIVVLAVVVLRGGLFGGAEKDIKIQSCQAALSRLSLCYDTSGVWQVSSVGPGTVPSACAGITVPGRAIFGAAGAADTAGCGTKPGA